LAFEPLWRAPLHRSVRGNYYRAISERACTELVRKVLKLAYSYNKKLCFQGIDNWPVFTLWEPLNFVFSGEEVVI